MPEVNNDMPAQALKKWTQQKLDFFIKCICEATELGIYVFLNKNSLLHFAPPSKLFKKSNDRITVRPQKGFNDIK
jgi:hypothetical protein